MLKNIAVDNTHKKVVLVFKSYVMVGSIESIGADFFEFRTKYPAQPICDEPDRVTRISYSAVKELIPLE